MSGRLRRGAWFALGWVAVGIGSIGVVVPGLPTTVFFVVAAACFSRSSPRFEQWVLDRPGIGPLVRDYRSGLGMPRTAKVTAVTTIVLVCSLSAFVGVERAGLRLVILAAGAFGVGWILLRIPTRADAGPPLASAGRWFRVVATAEAATWLGLLVGMAVKYVGSGSADGVQLFGPIHGIVVLVYVAVTLLVARRLGWGGRTQTLAVLASVPPLATLVVESWLARTGRLAPTVPAVSSGRRPTR